MVLPKNSKTCKPELAYFVHSFVRMTSLTSRYRLKLDEKSK